jgi:hypothetical protein
MEIGTLVQLLDPHGVPHEGFIGTVVGYKRDKVRVHWHCGAENYSNAAYQWGRLKVLAK